MLGAVAVLAAGCGGAAPAGSSSSSSTSSSSSSSSTSSGQPVTIDLTGAEPGLYEVETQEPSLRVLQLLVR